MKKLLLIFTLFSFFAEAQTQLSTQPFATTPTDADYIPLLQGGSFKKITASQLTAVPTTYVTQTGNYVIPDFTATDGVCKNFVIVGNGSNTISVPTTLAVDGEPKWFTNGGGFNNTKINYCYACALNGHINYSVNTHNKPAGADVTAPTFTFSPLNSATGVSITGNITITANEALYTTSNVLIDNSNVASVVQLKLTNSSGSTVAAAATISGNTITIDPTASLTNSTVYYASILPVEDLAGNASSTQSITFTTAEAGDVTAPVISSAATNTAGTVITLTYGESLNTSITPATTDFTTSPSKTISNVSVSGSTVLVTVSSAFVNGNTITISYTPGTNKIQDAAGNFAVALTGYSVTNNVPAGVSSLLTGLTAAYKLNEASGNRVSSVNASTYILNETGTVGVTTGQSGNAAQFDGTNRLTADRNTTHNLINQSEFTLTAWVVIPSGGSGFQTIAGKWGTSSLFAWLLYYDYSTGKLGLTRSSNGSDSNLIIETTTSPSSSYKFICLSKSSGNVYKLRVDNVADVTATNALTTPTDNQPFVVGASGHIGIQNASSFKIDEMYIWNRELTDSEKTTLFGGSYYPF